MNNLGELEVMEEPVMMAEPEAVQAYGKATPRIPLGRLTHGKTSRTIRNNMRGMKFHAGPELAQIGIAPNVRNSAKHGTRSLSPQPRHLGGGKTQLLTNRFQRLLGKTRTVSKSNNNLPVNSRVNYTNNPMGYSMPVSVQTVHSAGPVSFVRVNGPVGASAKAKREYVTRNQVGKKGAIGSASTANRTHAPVGSEIEVIEAPVGTLDPRFSNLQQQSMPVRATEFTVGNSNGPLKRSYGTRRLPINRPSVYLSNSSRPTLSPQASLSFSPRTTFSEKYVQPSFRGFIPTGGKRLTARRASKHARRKHGRRYRSRHTRR
jgi:hypothetical protein